MTIETCIINESNWPQLLTPMIALFGVVIAYHQLMKNNRTRQADFTHKLDVEFFTKESHILMTIIEFDAIKFIEPNNSNGDPYFKIALDKIEGLDSRYFELKKFVEDRSLEISTFEIDHFLLGHFEKIGIYNKKKIIYIEFIYETFDYYIQKVHKNVEIQKYIQWIRQNYEDQDIYNKFDFIANKSYDFSRKIKK